MAFVENSTAGPAIGFSLGNRTVYSNASLAAITHPSSSTAFWSRRWPRWPARSRLGARTPLLWAAAATWCRACPHTSRLRRGGRVRATVLRSTGDLACTPNLYFSGSFRVTPSAPKDDRPTPFCNTELRLCSGEAWQGTVSCNKSRVMSFTGYKEGSTLDFGFFTAASITNNAELNISVFDSNVQMASLQGSTIISEAFRSPTSDLVLDIGGGNCVRCALHGRPLRHTGAPDAEPRRACVARGRAAGYVSAPTVYVGHVSEQNAAALGVHHRKRGPHRACAAVLCGGYCARAGQRFSAKDVAPPFVLWRALHKNDPSCVSLKLQQVKECFDNHAGSANSLAPETQYQLRVFWNVYEGQQSEIWLDLTTTCGCTVENPSGMPAFFRAIETMDLVKFAQPLRASCTPSRALAAVTGAGSVHRASVPARWPRLRRPSRLMAVPGAAYMSMRPACPLSPHPRSSPARSRTPASSDSSSRRTPAWCAPMLARPWCTMSC